MTASIAITVAERLIDPAVVINAVQKSDAASLTHGLAGTALLHARLSTIDPRFAAAATRHWDAAATHLRRSPTGFNGIQGGQGGLAASLIVGTGYLPDPEQYRPQATRSAQWLAARAIDLANHHTIQSVESGPPWHVYDAITGLTGIGRVLLAAAEDSHPGIEPGLTATLNTLTGILAPRDHPRPGWWLAAEHRPPRPTIDPSGAASTGLAHGVAGPLAFLSTAHLAGWTRPGQTDAIHHAATWLLHWRYPDGTWPPAITGTELDNHSTPKARGRSDAWCYGTPGIANALTHAGHALDDNTLITAVSDALDAMAARDPDDWDVEGPTLCHGHAGILQATHHTKLAIADAAAQTITNHFDTTTKFGFQHHEHGAVHDTPGLLTGAAGIAMALADRHDIPARANVTTWDSLLNLS